MATDDLAAWLGPALDDLTPEQRDVVTDAARDIADRYPDPDDQDRREAALSATVQYLLGEATPEDVSRALLDARLAEARAYAAALQVAALMVRRGANRATAARRVGVDRMSLLKALGER